MGNTKNNYVPKPIDISGVDLPRDIEKLWEVLAENNHDIWAEKRKGEGWTYGEKRDDDLKQSPCLVPYDELSEDDKSYDREMAQASLKAIYKSGFKISTAQTGKVMLVGRYNKRFVDKFEKKAFDNDLQVVSYKNWNDAKADLAADITIWNAVVFDSEGEKKDKDCRKFMRNVIDDMYSIFHSTFNEIPWYICSSETDEFTQLLIQLAVGKERERKNWGKVHYLTDNEDISLLVENISNSKQFIKSYRMELMYGEVFKTIDKYFDHAALTKDYLNKSLLPLHYPEVFLTFRPDDFAGNVRKILDSILHVLIKYHYIPDIIVPGANPVTSLKEHEEPNLGFCIGHLERSYWCDDYITDILKPAKNGTSDKLHLSKFENDGLYHIMTCFALQLADVIVWLGKFIDSSKSRIEELNGTVCKLKVDDHQNCYYEDCLIADKTLALKAYREGNQVVLKNVRINNHHMNKYFLYIAEVEVL